MNLKTWKESARLSIGISCERRLIRGLKRLGQEVKLDRIPSPKRVIHGNS